MKKSFVGLSFDYRSDVFSKKFQLLRPLPPQWAYGPRRGGGGRKNCEILRNVRRNFTRIAPILTIFGQNRSQRRDLDFEKKSGAVVVVVVVVVAGSAADASRAECTTRSLADSSGAGQGTRRAWELRYYRGRRPCRPRATVCCVPRKHSNCSERHHALSNAMRLAAQPG